ncbi:MAG: TolB family protein, partial [Cyclobacteriaceae bacterium]
MAENIEYELGDAYHYNSQFEKAIVHYKKYKQRHEHHDKILDNINRKIRECENGIEFRKHIDKKIEIENLGRNINSEADDFSPVISLNEGVLLFTSRRKGTTGDTHYPSGKFKDDIYISVNKNGEWTEAQNLKYLNTFLEDRVVSLSPNGKKLITYREDGKGDLFYSLLDKNGTWGDLVRFPQYISNIHSRETHAAISHDWKTLIFTSDRKGGYGGLDLYISTRKHKTDAWGNPRNLGAKINTPLDDNSPFLDI